MAQEELDQNPQSTGPLRIFLLVLGCVLTVLGTIGAFLPVLPTTPFVLLAAACFARSSPAFHRRLLSNRIFGPYVAQWQSDHTIPRDAKRKAYGLVIVTFAFSIAWFDSTGGRVVLLVLGASLIVFLTRLPTSAEAGEDDSE